MDIQGPCLIWGPLSIRPIGGASHISIGAGTFVNTDVRFGGAQGGISIGRNVQVGPRVSFETVSHGLLYEPGRGRGYASHPIVVEDEVWIGAGTIVLQGVTIGRGAVISAGAVVKDDVPAGTVAGGVPARVLRAVE
jgi:maltose O-acetyltransferase